MKQTKTIIVIISLMMSLFLFSCSENNSVEYFTIGTAGTAGSLYPMGVAMAETLTNHVEGFQVTGEATAASIENLRNLHNGELGWGISQTEIASMAYYGLGDYEGQKYDDIRALFSTIDNYLQVFTVEGSGVESIEDFRGKAIGVGASGSGGEMMARTLLTVYGMTYDDISPQFMPESEAVSALKDGRIAAFIATHPLKSSVLVDLTTSSDAVMLSVDNDAFYDLIPAYSKYVVPPNTYSGIDYGVTIPKARIIMCTSTNAGFSDDEIYEMVKAIWENRSEWSSASNAVETQVLLERSLEELDIPLHNGAIRYYEEVGMTIPDNLR